MNSLCVSQSLFAYLSMYFCVRFAEATPKVAQAHSRPLNTYWAMLARTLLANRDGVFFSSSVGTCGGKN